MRSRRSSREILYYSSDVIAAFVPREHRALMEAVETNIFAKMNSVQTVASNLKSQSTQLIIDVEVAAKVRARPLLPQDFWQLSSP